MDRHAWVNSVDPDKTLQNVASDQCLHRFPLVQQILRTHYENTPIQIYIKVHFQKLKISDKNL